MFGFIKRVITEIRLAGGKAPTPEKLEESFSQAIGWVWGETIALRFLQHGRVTTLEELEQILEFAVKKKKECIAALLAQEERRMQKQAAIDVAKLSPQELVAARKELPKTVHEERQVKLAENLANWCRQKLHYCPVVEAAIATAKEKIERREYGSSSDVVRMNENDVHIEVTLSDDFDVEEDICWIGDVLKHTTGATTTQWWSFTTKQTTTLYSVRDPYSKEYIGDYPRVLRQGVRIILVFG